MVPEQRAWLQVVPDATPKSLPVDPVNVRWNGLLRHLVGCRKRTGPVIGPAREPLPHSFEIRGACELTATAWLS